MSSRHGKAIVFMNSQQLWLCAHDHASEHSSLGGGRAQELLPRAKELLIVDGGGEDCFL